MKVKKHKEKNKKKSWKQQQVKIYNDQSGLTLTLSSLGLEVCAGGL